MNWIILPIDQHTKKRESSGGILDKLDNSLVDEHTKKKNYPDESLDNSFLGEIHPDESEPYDIYDSTIVRYSTVSMGSTRLGRAPSVKMLVYT